MSHVQTGQRTGRSIHVSFIWSVRHVTIARVSPSHQPRAALGRNSNRKKQRECRGRGVVWLTAHHHHLDEVCNTHLPVWSFHSSPRSMFHTRAAHYIVHTHKISQDVWCQLTRTRPATTFSLRDTEEQNSEFSHGSHFSWVIHKRSLMLHNSVWFKMVLDTWRFVACERHAGSTYIMNQPSESFLISLSNKQGQLCYKIVHSFGEESQRNSEFLYYILLILMR